MIWPVLIKFWRKKSFIILFLGSKAKPQNYRVTYQKFEDEKMDSQNKFNFLK